MLPSLRCPLLLMLPLLMLAACSRAPESPATPTLSQDVYVWQRQWTPALRAALDLSNAQVSRWHVLGAELGASGRWIDISPDAQALGRTGKPLIMTVRINGQLARLDAVAIQTHLLMLLEQWRARGLQVAALEIDHDCATARLPEYISSLRALKTRIAPLALSVTTLPTWLSSTHLDALLAVADQSVLQVHAVLDPRLGLFDPVRARHWMTQYAARTRRPWHVALPAYGTRVVWDEQGRIAAVESEQRLLAGGVGRELMAQPQQLTDFVSNVTRAPPRHLAGIIWFRLPSGDDRRAWSLSTWMAVLERRPLKAALMARLVVPAQAGQGSELRRDILLDNGGAADAPLPRQLRLAAGPSDRAGASGPACAADGINGYVLEHDRQGSYLRLIEQGLLRAGSSRVIGWIRCGSPQQTNDIALQIGS